MVLRLTRDQMRHTQSPSRSESETVEIRGSTCLRQRREDMNKEQVAHTASCHLSKWTGRSRGRHLRDGQEGQRGLGMVEHV